MPRRNLKYVSMYGLLKRTRRSPAAAIQAAFRGYRVRGASANYAINSGRYFTRSNSGKYNMIGKRKYN